MARPTLYVETTIPSYLASRPSRDVIVLAHQQITAEWWTTRRLAFDLRVSELVILEAGRGDPELARARREFLDGIPLLDASSQVGSLAEKYVTELQIPEQARNDAVHLAFATVHEVDYLLTWNCAHLANAVVRRKFQKLNGALRLSSPTICTPEELLESLP